MAAARAIAGPGPARRSARAYWAGRALRRLPLALAVASVIAGLAVLAVRHLPPVYAAQAQVTLVAPELGDDRRAAVPAPGQLQLYRERLLARETLLAVAHEVGVFPPQRRMSPDRIVAAMARATRITTQSGRDQAPLLEIGFRARSPALAAGVVRALLSRLLEEDRQQRIASSQAAVAFFGREVTRAGAALDGQAKEVLTFRRAHRLALPENRSRLEADLADLRARQDALNRPAPRPAAPPSQTEATRQLAAAETELAQARALYSERNPRVVLIATRVAALRRAVEAERLADSRSRPDPASGPAARAARSAELGRQITARERALADIPANALALEAFDRDGAAMRQRYRAAVEKRDAARRAERIALSAGGERLEVVSPPEVPSDPVAPRRRLILTGGIGAGLVAGAVLAVLLEISDRRVRRGRDLVRHLGITPLAVLPRIASRGERLARLALRAGGALALAAVLGLGLLAVSPAGGGLRLDAGLMLARLRDLAG